MKEHKDELLSVLLHTDSFFYKQYGNSGNLIKSFKGDFANNTMLEDMNASDRMICFTGLPFTHVPLQDFEPLRLQEYLQHLSYIIDIEDWIFNYDKLRTANICTVYGVPSAKVNKLTKSISKLHCRHLSSLLIDYSNETNQNGVFIHLEEKEAFITVVNKLRFQYYNQVRITSVEDLLYFMTLTYKNFEFDRSSFPTIFSGAIHHDFENYKKLKEYFVNLHFQGEDNTISEVSSDFSTSFLDHVISQCVS